MDTIRVEIRAATAAYPKFVVLVHEFKFDTIRQESYWTCKTVKEYRLRKDAEAFARRFGWIG